MKGRWLVVAVSVAALVPVLAFLLLIFWMGFWQDGPGDPIVYTLKHYRKMFTDPSTYRTLLNTLGFATTAVLVALFFAVPTAWLVERTDLPGKNLIFILVTIGALVPTFFTSMGWVFLFHPRIGIVNHFFVELFGLQQAPFNIASLVGMGWVEGLGLSSIAFIMIVATYRRMDPALEEAARVHGLGIFRTFRYVTLPLTFPGIIAAAIYIFTIGLSAFEVPAIIGMSNKIFTFSTFIFYKIQPQEELPSYGMAGAVSSLLIVLALLLSWGYFRTLKFSHRYAVVTGKGYRPRLVELGPARVVSGLVVFGRLFYRRQVVAVSPAGLGVAVALFPAALLGGVGAGVAEKFLRLAVESAFPGCLEYCAANGDGADRDVGFMLGDFLDGAALGSQMARQLRCRGVFAPRRAASDSRHRRSVRLLIPFARCGFALRQLGDSDYCLHHQPDQLRHPHHQ